MKTSEKGIALICKFEGFRLKAYLCPAGVWTIGYGHTGIVDGKPICEGMKISKGKALELLQEDLEKFERKVSAFKYKWNQNEFDAMVSFAYNVGSIDQLTAGGTRTKKVIAEKILLYNKAGGKELSGLNKRRHEERALFVTV